MGDNDTNDNDEDDTNNHYHQYLCINSVLLTGRHINVLSVNITWAPTTTIITSTTSTTVDTAKLFKSKSKHFGDEGGEAVAKLDKLGFSVHRHRIANYPCVQTLNVKGQGHVIIGSEV